MTKKTKKEKIIADYRRKIKLLHQMNIQNIQKEYPKDNKKDVLLKEKTDREINKEKVNFPLEERKLTDDNKFLDYNLIVYFKNDFKKSLIISFFIIALEFLTYFAMLKIKFN